MKKNIHVIIFIFLILGGLTTSCKSEEDEPSPKIEVLFVNESSIKIWIYTTSMQISHDCYEVLHTYHITELAMNEEKEMSLSIIENKKDLYFEFKIITEETYRKYTSEEILKQDIFDERYTMSYEELKNNIFTIKYGLNDN